MPPPSPSQPLTDTSHTHTHGGAHTRAFKHPQRVAQRTASSICTYTFVTYTQQFKKKKLTHNYALGLVELELDLHTNTYKTMVSRIAIVIFEIAGAYTSSFHDVAAMLHNFFGTALTTILSATT